MAENRPPTRLSIAQEPHRYQADEDLVARFICHANSTHVLQSLWRGLHADLDLLAQALILQRHFALAGSAASVLGTLQRGLIILATH